MLRRFIAHAGIVVATAAIASASLTPKVTVSGKITLSIDGAGTNADCSNSANFISHPHCQLKVNKPNSGSTAKRVFLIAASTGFSGYQIPDGGISLDGHPVKWEGSPSPIYTENSIGSYNTWAELTSVSYPAIFAKLNAAAPGTVNFTVIEDNSYSIDGEVLVVIWDNPSAPQTTVSLMYGAQSVGGDAFSVTLAQPLDKTNPATVLDMSLGISFGYQPSGQYSILELGVNGTRISTSAGGQDDGEDENGALITAGGIGDTNANPIDPMQTDSNGSRYDDELYNLLPFLSNGTTSFTINTQNPSNDDNIFFAAIVLGNNTAAVGEGITLGPATQSANVSTNQTVTAAVQNALGGPISGRTVTFTVTSGVNNGVSGTAVTNASGQATFTYSSTLAGSDTLQARMTNSSSEIQLSNTANVTWQGTNTPTLSVGFTNGSGDTTPVNQNYTLNARVANSIGQPQSGVTVTFTALSGPRAGVLGSASTNASGIASIAYTSGTAGTDVLQASIAGPVTSSTITHDWTVVLSPSLLLTPSAQTNPVNGQATLKAQALDGSGSPVAGVAVTATTSAGPNHSKTLNGTTGADGFATMTYISSLSGTDVWSASATISATLATSSSVSRVWSGRLCDVNGDTKIDIDDIKLIQAALNQPATAGDPRDSIFDGVINAQDAAACVKKCDKMGCAK